jgi:hypothetical protein
MTFYYNVYNGRYTDASISTNRLLDFMDFNSNQRIVYSDGYFNSSDGGGFGICHS